MSQTGWEAHQKENELRDASFAELIKRLGDDMATLVRQEMQLAKAEMAEKMDVLRSEMATTVDHVREDASTAADRVKRDVEQSAKNAGAGAGMLAGAAAIGLLALGTLTAFLVLALDGAMPNWAAALVVTGVYAVLAAVLAMVGRDRIKAAFPLVSPRTMQSVKRDAAEIVQETKDRASGAASELKPEETIETVKEDVEWAKHPTRSA